MPEESHKEQAERLRREREARERAARQRAADGAGLGGLAHERIWPSWTRTLGAMIESEAIVRFVCRRCKRLYDVDVASLAVLRGRMWSLIGRKAACKASQCRARGFFVAAVGMDDPLFSLGGGDLPKWLIGARPRDHEAPDNDPGPDDDRPPPCPKGVDAVRWAYADEAGRERLRKGEW